MDKVTNALMLIQDKHADYFMGAQTIITDYVDINWLDNPASIKFKDDPQLPQHIKDDINDHMSGI
jgi:hypothetical protein